MTAIRPIFSSIYLSLIALAAVFLLSVVPAKSAQAETFNTCAGFITSLPFTITTQGTWCMKNDLTTSDGTQGYAAITVATNNVTIDCNDFKLGGLAAGAATSAAGIFADNRDNVTIRHCNIRGFYFGAYLNNGSGHLVEDNRFDGNTTNGIVVGGDRSIIRRNLVIATGGLNDRTYGIYSSGSVDILDNTVNRVTSGSVNGNSYGIYTANNPDGRISGNSVRGVVKGGSGTAYGIYTFSSGRIMLGNNQVVGDGSAGSIGLYCNSAQGRATGNVVGGFATNISTCSGTSNEIVY